MAFSATLGGFGARRAGRGRDFIDIRGASRAGALRAKPSAFCERLARPRWGGAGAAGAQSHAMGGAAGRASRKRRQARRCGPQVWDLDLGNPDAVLVDVASARAPDRQSPRGMGHGLCLALPGLASSRVGPGRRRPLLPAVPASLCLEGALFDNNCGAGRGQARRRADLPVAVLGRAAFSLSEWPLRLLGLLGAPCHTASFHPNSRTFH